MLKGNVLSLIAIFVVSNTVREELKAILDMGVIAEFHSDWSGLVVLVPKADGSIRFRVNFKKSTQCRTHTRTCVEFDHEP